MEDQDQLDALEKAAEDTLAEGAFEFDEDEGVLRIEGTLVLTTSWFLASGVVGVACLLVGAVLSLTGLTGWARWALAPGTVLIAVPLLCVLTVRSTPLSRLWPDLELHFPEQMIVYRRARVPFRDLCPEHLVWKTGPVFRQLYLRHPMLRKQLAGFWASEERQAEEFHRQLWKLVSEPDLPGLLTRGSDLTPTQRWIIGAGAFLGAINGFRLDRLGTAPTAEGAEADRRTAEELLQDPWGAYDLEHLLAAVDWLVQQGHRADFTQDAALAARPEPEKAEYARSLREVDDLIARERTEPPFVDRLIELVRLRYGPARPAYAELVLPLMQNEPGADASPEGAELALFLGQLINNRDHAGEELHRLKMLADPALLTNAGRFLIWDYGRALMLYRWGHMVGWLAEEYCWAQMLPLARDIQRHYASWQDMAICYLQGRLLWSGGGGEMQGEFERLAERLGVEPNSPWTLVPWDLELRRDWS